MNEAHLKNVIEAALLASGRPLTIEQIAHLFDEHMRPSAAEVRTQLGALSADYAERGIEMKETASGFRVQVRGALAGEISRLWPERPPRFSRALLETLALIAYRQPITRAEIEAVRGVAVNPNILKTLIERNWVRVVGQRDVPGHPELLGTTRDFLDYFGLKTLDELPPLAALTAMADVNLQLDLGAAPRAADRIDGQAATALLDDDTAEDDEHLASPSEASELVASGPNFDS
jgi:segregation and condensation protein B